MNYALGYGFLDMVKSFNAERFFKVGWKQYLDVVSRD